MPDDTQIGGPQARFPTTRWSAVNGVAGSDPEERGRAFGAIVGNLIAVGMILGDMALVKSLNNRATSCP